MINNARAHVAAHPGESPMVQFNHPAGTMIIASISDAIEKHFVSVNPAGLALIKAMGGWGEHKEPTMTMVRIVMECLEA